MKCMKYIENERINKPLQLRIRVSDLSRYKNNSGLKGFEFAPEVAKLSAMVSFISHLILFFCFVCFSFVYIKALLNLQCMGLFWPPRNLLSVLKIGKMTSIFSGKEYLTNDPLNYQ